jgi:hypothetical protein
MSEYDQRKAALVEFLEKSAESVKKKTQFQGIPIHIDRPKGTVHVTSVGDTMNYKVDYGFIPKTKSTDGESVDVYMGPDRGSKNSFWIENRNRDGSFDEHKVMLGYKDRAAAVRGFLDHYPRRCMGTVTPVPMLVMHALLSNKKGLQKTAQFGFAATIQHFDKLAAEALEKQALWDSLHRTRMGKAGIGAAFLGSVDLNAGNSAAASGGLEGDMGMSGIGKSNAPMTAQHAPVAKPQPGVLAAPQRSTALTNKTTAPWNQSAANKPAVPPQQKAMASGAPAQPNRQVASVTQQATAAAKPSSPTLPKPPAPPALAAPTVAQPKIPPIPQATFSAAGMPKPNAGSFMGLGKPATTAASAVTKLPGVAAKAPGLMSKLPGVGSIARTAAKVVTGGKV